MSLDMVDEADNNPNALPQPSAAGLANKPEPRVQQEKAI